MINARKSLPAEALPQHVAVIMDGNGRWAQKRLMPRGMGHQAGTRTVRRVLRAAHKAGVKVLTVYAFSQENWQRPPEEVRLLMQLFIRTLTREVNAMHKNGVRISFIGDHHDFVPELREAMRHAETLTRHNTGVRFVVAVGYGGQQEIVSAARRVITAGQSLTLENVASHLDTADLPHPDLMIRTGGEHRISNFLLWQLAYAELYFTDTLWPDFKESEFREALAWYAGRQRRFGRVPEGA